MKIRVQGNRKDYSLSVESFAEDPTVCVTKLCRRYIYCFIRLAITIDIYRQSTVTAKFYTDNRGN